VDELVAPGGGGLGRRFLNVFLDPGRSVEVVYPPGVGEPAPSYLAVGPWGLFRRPAGNRVAVFEGWVVALGMPADGSDDSFDDEILRASLAEVAPQPGRLPLLVLVNSVNGVPSWRPDRLEPITAEQAMAAARQALWGPGVAPRMPFRMFGW